MPGNGVGTSTGGIGSIIGLVLGLVLVCFVMAMCTSGGGNVPPPPTAAPTALPQPADTPNFVPGGGSSGVSPVVINIQNTDPPIENAIVRVAGTPQPQHLDNNQWILPPCTNDQDVSVWAPGYYILPFKSKCFTDSTVPYNVQLEAIIQVNQSCLTGKPAS